MPSFRMQGAACFQTHQMRSRVIIAISAVCLIYGIIGARLCYYGLSGELVTSAFASVDASISSTRPDLLDRNGEILATDINTSSLYAEPHRIVDADEAVELLSTVLPDLDMEVAYRRLKSNSSFVWLKRELTPATEDKIMELGIPGIGFRKETKRFYPAGPTASHLIGLVNIDNVGIAGLEKYIDDRGLKELRAAGFTSNTKLDPVKLSIDLRVQHFVRQELADAMERYQAIGAGAVVLNAKTGEVVAMASMPDFNPNHPVDALKKDRLNRMSAGAYEMGSTFKGFTTAMALESGKVTLNSRLDATQALRFGRFKIHDFHAKGRVLTVPEVFIYSSNIGTAKMAEKVGVDAHREFFHKLGLLDRMDFELPEVASPMEPKVWKPINSITISYGHGASTTPLQTAVAGAALVNGGKLVSPTLFPRSQAQADALAKHVLSERTSKEMRYLMRLNVEKGSGRRAEVKGYRVGGKTGTAEKVVKGRYSSDKRFNAFLAAFPVDDPQYVVLSIIDEPKPEKGQHSATAGMNAAPMVHNIISRAAPLLGVKPEFSGDSIARLVLQ